jgi:hypothetical protein
MAASTLSIGTVPQQRGTLVFTGANDIGPQLIMTLTLVQFSPSGSINFIGDEYGILELTGEALADEDGSFGTIVHPDDAAVTPDISNYYVGTGTVTWTPEATTAVPTPTARDLGNCNVFEFTQEYELLDHWNRRGGTRYKDFRPVTQQSANLRIELDEWTAENLRLAMFAGPPAVVGTARATRTAPAARAA